jgi:hypothetical protein
VRQKEVPVNIYSAESLEEKIMAHFNNNNPALVW